MKPSRLVSVVASQLSVVKINKINQLKERQVDKLRLSSLLSKYVNRWFPILSIELLQTFENKCSD